MYLNKDVAVRVAATLINAVVAAVVIIVVEGKGTSTSVNGISTICASGGNSILGTAGLAVGLVSCCCSSLGGSSCISNGCTPAGGCRVLGGTTRGV